VTAATPAAAAVAPADSFPRQYARTQRLTLGEPRTVTVSPDGRRVAFVRSRGGSDPVNCLWVLDVASGTERLVADPRQLLTGADDDHLPPEERARRERAREGAGGVVSFTTDAAVTVAAFTLGSRLFVAGLISGAARELRAPGPVFDPTPDPLATQIAYVREGTLCIAALDGSAWELAGDDDPDVSWGVAEFVAAEEMGRGRGYWWAPDGRRIAACRVDNQPVARWWIGDPARPDAEPREHRYPAAGTANAAVELWVLDLDEGERRVEWDRSRYPYLCTVAWTSPSALLLSVQSRDQREVAYLVADADTGATDVRLVDVDPQWVELVRGTPGMLGDGRLVTCADRDGARRLIIDGVPVSPPRLQVRSIAAVGADHVVFHANPVSQPTVQHVLRWWVDGRVEYLSAEAGVHAATSSGTTVVIRSATMRSPFSNTRVVGGPVLENLAEAPLVQPRVELLTVGARDLRAALLLPSWASATTRLPVLLDPYGGPHAQRVVESRAAYLASQWFADQGFAVIVIDGRGTPGRGSAWERAVHLDLAGPALEDQVDGLFALADVVPQLDLSKVAIRGWSFGGYLAALAVLRRPDVFHAAIAGAPVTDWQLYDTHYTERYLGDPVARPDVYEQSSLIADAGRLTRPLLLVHGFADDNVVAAHSLRLSSALLAAGRPHRFLPLAGVSHMTPQEVVAENLLLFQLAFLRDALGLPDAPGAAPEAGPSGGPAQHGDAVAAG
jgi:dipeptidyl-peptidase-4